jgi:hypothetical protein
MTALTVQKAVLCCYSSLAPRVSGRSLSAAPDCGQLTMSVLTERFIVLLFPYAYQLYVRWEKNKAGGGCFNPPVIAAVSDWYRPLQRWWVQTVCEVLHSLVSTNTHDGTGKPKNNISCLDEGFAGKSTNVSHIHEALGPIISQACYIYWDFPVFFITSSRVWEY